MLDLVRVELARSEPDVRHVFTLLLFVLRVQPLRAAYRGLRGGDSHARGTALEYLHSVLPKDIRDALWGFVLCPDLAGRPTLTAWPRHIRPGRGGQWRAARTVCRAKPPRIDLARLVPSQNFTICPIFLKSAVNDVAQGRQTCDFRGAGERILYQRLCLRRRRGCVRYENIRPLTSVVGRWPRRLSFKLTGRSR
jgi:hypothetical protein